MNKLIIDAVIDYLPSPLWYPCNQRYQPDTDEEETRPASDDEPFAALAFKIMTNHFVGRLDIYPWFTQVSFQSGSYVMNNTSKGKRERIGRILKCTLTAVKKLNKYTPVISLLLSV